MFQLKTSQEMNGRCIRYELFDGVDRVSWRIFLDLLQSSQPFRGWYTATLKDSPFDVFRWETPALTLNSLDQAFEFVLVDAPDIDLPADPTPFRGYITHAEQGVVSFENLGADALMVVPTLLTRQSAYPHLGAFLQTAPDEQIDRLWCMVGDAVHNRMSDNPLWLNTAGGGVAWLHVRLDSMPKYYVYKPYSDI